MTTLDGTVRIIEYGVAIRGDILARVVSLESAMNLFLAQHFCRDNGMTIELLEMVFATKRITFDYKREILNGIIIKYYPNLGVKINNGKTLCNKIKEIAEKRNVFAHYALDVNETSVEDFNNEKTLNFLKYSYSESKVRFTRKDIANLIHEISFCNKIMLKMIEK